MRVQFLVELLSMKLIMVVSAIGVRILAVAAVIECGIFVLVVDL